MWTKRCSTLQHEKIIKILKKRDGMSEDEALEYFYYNIKGSYMGEGTPLFFDDI